MTEKKDAFCIIGISTSRETVSTMGSKYETELSETEDYYDEDVWQDPAEDQRSRFMKVMSTSYGVSLLVHIVALFVLSLVVYFVPSPAKKVVVISKTETRMEVDPPERDIAEHETPEVDRENTEEKPVVELQEPEIPSPDPKGESMDSLTNVQQNNNTLSDAAGISGGGASAFGLPTGYGHRTNDCGIPGGNEIIDAGLRWLRDHQSPNGRWDADNWHDNCRKGRCTGPGHNQGDSRYDVGITAMSTLAFLGNGHTHRFGKYKRVLAKSTRWLTKQQKSDGSIGFHEGEEIYNHAIATMALCEAFAMSRDFKLKGPAQRAVNFCLQAQNPGQGWRYGVRPGDNDTSVTGWMVLALKAAKTGGLKVPEDAFEGAQNWFKRATGPNGAVGYKSAGGGSSYIPAQKGKFNEVPCMTAVSVVCRIFAGEKSSQRQIKQGVSLLMKSLPSKKSDHSLTNYYYWYYASYAMFQVGGQKWKKWSKPIFKLMIDSARKNGCEKGSYDPVSEWSIAGGRVYATAINLLTLEVVKRYKRIKK